MSGHSKIGASSAKRWMACPGSVRMSQGVENVSSVFAAEGTVAHWIGEEVLKYRANCASDFLGRTVEQDGHKIEVTREMTDAVQVYVDTVMGDMMPGDDLLVEHGFHIHELHDDLWGTNDACLFTKADKRLIVYDYKHGAGVAVEVEHNPQLMYYGIGALMASGFPAKEVELVIVQPRCPHDDGPVRRWVIDTLDLIDWSADLVDAAKATEDPNAPLCAGDHCRWCPGAGICPELEKQALTAAQAEFKPELSYDPEKLAEALDKVPLVEAWCKSVREFAYNEAEHGRCPPRHKLVKKRPTRKWRDPDETIDWLKAYGMDPNDIFKEPDLRSPAQIEKILGKEHKDDVEHLVVKESSGHKLVHEDAKGEPVKLGAEEEFSPLS